MAGYGAAAYESSVWKGTQSLRDRRRVNLVAIVYSVLLPCAIFAAVFFVMGWTLRFQRPDVAYTTVTICGLVVAALLACAVNSQRKKRGGEGEGQREPNWLMFVALTALVAFVAAAIGGELNYRSYIQPYLSLENLATYVNVDARTTRGEQVMDSGVITFASGTQMNVNLSMGFSHQRVYCVAPITVGDGKLASYDFWAVGTDCCSGGASDFHCGELPFRRGSPGGLRLLRDEEKPYFLLAVQQAEATYGIKAVHPLFFDWEPDPVSMVNSWQEQAHSYLFMGMIAYLCIQMFFVAVASMAFAKLGSQGRL